MILTISIIILLEWAAGTVVMLFECKALRRDRNDLSEALNHLDRENTEASELIMNQERIISKNNRNYAIALKETKKDKATIKILQENVSSLIKNDHKDDESLIKRLEAEINDKSKIINELEEDSKKDMLIIQEHIKRIAQAENDIAILKKQRPIKRKKIGNNKKQ